MACRGFAPLLKTPVVMLDGLQPASADKLPRNQRLPRAAARSAELGQPLVSGSGPNCAERPFPTHQYVTTIADIETQTSSGVTHSINAVTHSINALTHSINPAYLARHHTELRNRETPQGRQSAVASWEPTCAVLASCPHKPPGPRRTRAAARESRTAVACRRALSGTAARRYAARQARSAVRLVGTRS